MKQIDRKEASRIALVQIGLPQNIESIDSVEALAGSFRRASAFLCPCPAKTLISSLRGALKGLTNDQGTLDQQIVEILESIISYGDIRELRNVPFVETDKPVKLLYACPPAFVHRQSGEIFLVGIDSDGVSRLPAEILNRIQYIGHTRRIVEHLGEDLGENLSKLGYIRLSEESWLNMPRNEYARDYVSGYLQRLDLASPSGDMKGITVLNPHMNVLYYPGRWTDSDDLTGDFVCRRPQRYGNDIWCFTRISNGLPQKFIDLPLAGSRYSGFDEACRIQLAIDFERKSPQRFRIRPESNDSFLLDLFSPIPSWARRRWDFIATKILPDGCLISYRLADDNLESELDFLRDKLWLANVQFNHPDLEFEG